MKSIRKIFILAAVFCCLASMALPTNAAEPVSPDDSFCISFTLKFFDKGEIDNTVPLEAYQENAFLLTDLAGWYLQADYNDADNAYHLTGWTLEEAAATRLRCGQSLEEPGYVAVMGLPGGTYHLAQLEATTGYWGLRCPLILFLSKTDASLNGEPCPINNDSSIRFCVLNSPSFRMPATCRWCELQYALQDGILTVEAVVITVLFTFVAVKLYRVYRAKKYAKAALDTMLVSLLVPVSLLILCLAGVLSFTHRLGPVIGSLSGSAYGIYFIAAGFLALRKCKLLWNI